LFRNHHFVRLSIFGRPNAQNGGTPSAPGAVGAHPFQMIASRKRSAIIT
jgi:hypothetical protein